MEVGYLCFQKAPRGFLCTMDPKTTANRMTKKEGYYRSSQIAVIYNLPVSNSLKIHSGKQNGNLVSYLQGPPSICLWGKVYFLVAVVQFSHVPVFVTPWTAACQASCPSPSPRACSNSCPSSQRCHPTILFSVIPFSSRLQSFPASGFFLISQFFALGAQRIGVSASALVLPMNIQD